MMQRALYVLLALVVAVLWTYLLVHSVELETRQEFVLDRDTGEPVEVWRIGK
jgi:hypothetical protein